MFLTFVHNGNSKGSIVHATELWDLKTAHQCHMISGLHTGAAQYRDCLNLKCNLEIGTQFPDFENALRNLEIAQIPRLHGTYIPINNYYK